MTVVEFIGKTDFDNLIKDFISPENRFKNIGFSDFAPNVYQLFLENKIKIEESFLNEIEDKLVSEHWDFLKENFSILFFDLFDETSIQRIRNIFRIINSIIENHSYKVKSSLLEFCWTLLDYILSTEIYNQFNEELISLKNNLNLIEIFLDYKELLFQKLEHYNL